MTARMIQMPLLNKEEKFNYQESKPAWRKYISLWKSYPDYFLDFIKDSRCNIKLHWYQRIFLRALFRFRKVYITATRGTAKTYTCILAMYLLCIFYPDIKLAICAPIKEQAADLAWDNIQAIWSHFPILYGEIRKYERSNDDITLYFWGGSRLDIVQQTNASKGGRRNGVLIEEVALPETNGDKLDEVVLPLMANPRIEVCGGIDPNEIQNREFYMTTAGTRQSYGFHTLQNTLRDMQEGLSAIYIGAGYEMPCDVEQLEYETVRRRKRDMNPLTFAREFESVWTGSSDKSLVSSENLQNCRKLTNTEEYAEDQDAEYVLSYDVAHAGGNKNANSVLAVLKIKERSNGEYSRSLVNMFGKNGGKYRDQALFLKDQVKTFNARILVVDANGIGSSIVELLMEDLGDGNPPYAVVNDDKGEYAKRTLPNAIPMIYVMIAHSKGQSNSDMFDEFIRVINNNKLSMPHSVNDARALRSKGKNKLTGEALTAFLRPYAAIDAFIEETLNLEYKQSGHKTDIKQISRSIQKDRFIAVVYGLYWIYLQEIKNKLRNEEEIDWKSFIHSGSGKATITQNK